MPQPLRATLPDVRENRAKIAWVAVSVPTLIVTEVEGIAFVGLVIAVFGWALSHWFAVRG